VSDDPERLNRLQQIAFLTAPARYEWLRGLGTISAGLIARGLPVF
jgi:hypothetical protein